MQKKKQKPHGELHKLRADKEGNISSQFNFLENLLVFRTMEELSVPPESSVKFRITRTEADAGICLLIHIDNQKYPLFESHEARPDYLAVYLHGNGCICTIIEMKSKDGKNLKHGLEQIKSLADRLRQEFSECLPKKFRLHIQGILLSQFNSQVPGKLIEEMAAKGLTILTMQSNSRAELFPYISQINAAKTKPTNDSRSPTSQSPLEKMLSRDSLKKRLIEPQTAEERGLCISYILSDLDEFVTLTVRNKRCTFVISEEGTAYAELIQNDIAANGLEEKFLVEALEQ